MKRRPSKKRSQGGFTLVELLVTVAVMGILFSMASASYETLKSKIRFSQAKGDMDAIAKAAYSYYTDANFIWPDLAFGEMPVAMNNGKYLDKWPKAPCPQWYYSWEDWSTFGIDAVSVTLRRPNDTIYLNFCVGTVGGNCYASDPSPFSGGTPTDISTTDHRYLFCNE